jgi:hypothetical protein
MQLNGYDAAGLDLLSRRTIKARPLEPEELSPVLRRESNEQCFRIAELKDALTEQDYLRVSELMDSLGGPLAQHVAHEEKQVLLLDSHTHRSTRRAMEALQQTRSANR